MGLRDVWMSRRRQSYEGSGNVFARIGCARFSIG